MIEYGGEQNQDELKLPDFGDFNTPNDSLWSTTQPTDTQYAPNPDAWGPPLGQDATTRNAIPGLSFESPETNPFLAGDRPYGLLPVHPEGAQAQTHFNF